MASISTVSPLWDTMPLQTAKTSTTEDSSNSLFGDIFQSAIDSVKETDAEKTEAEYLLSTGQLDNPATLTIATTKAQLSVDLLVNLRNKALDSYSELMRISI